MIKNNALGDKLNSYNQNEIPDLIPAINTPLLKFIDSIFTIIIIFIKSVALGYGLKLIFVTDWNFLGILAIGFTLDTLIDRIFDLFHKK